MAQVAKKKAKVRRPSTKRSHNRKFARFNIGILEVMKIKAAWLSSEKNEGTYTAIAKLTGHDRETVSAVINCPEMKAWAEAMGNELLRTTAEEVTGRIRYEITNRKSRNGPWMAMELAERWGAIPAKVTQVAAKVAMEGAEGIKEEYHALPAEERRNYWVKRLSEVTVERQELFDMPMPHLDAIKEEEEARTERRPERLLTLSLVKKEQAE